MHAILLPDFRCLDANAESSVVDSTFDQDDIDQTDNRPDLIVDLGFIAFLFPVS